MTFPVSSMLTTSRILLSNIYNGPIELSHVLKYFFNPICRLTQHVLLGCHKTFFVVDIFVVFRQTLEASSTLEDPGN